jgi:hypothetical protein
LKMKLWLGQLVPKILKFTQNYKKTLKLPNSSI